MTEDTLTYKYTDIGTGTDSTRTEDKKEERPCLAFLKISASTHLPVPTTQTDSQPQAKEPILPTHDFNNDNKWYF